ncbi:MAG TPA: L-histidine N(alpha)-methyltransferase [Terracidiphilus sp.]
MALLPLVPVSDQLASAVRGGLTATPKSLPPWLLYDDAGSALFDEITRLPEYYLTRTERGIFARHADAIVAQAAQGSRLRIAELGAGSAEKTQLLLAAAARLQGRVHYEPVDVSLSALEAACTRIHRELPAVTATPRLVDYTEACNFAPCPGERRLVLYIGSSIGNFSPAGSARILASVRAALVPGDALLLGVDLVKPEPLLHAAYNDAAGVTAAFNRNLLIRLNRELGADFNLQSFAHVALWNPAESRIEMHLESLCDQSVDLPPLDLRINFARGERIHTENSYKYTLARAGALLRAAGFAVESTWTDDQSWFAEFIARAV